MKIERTKTVTYGEGGWRAEVYTDDDNGSGYGGNPMWAIGSARVKSVRS